jgi:hypothetical protein
LKRERERERERERKREREIYKAFKTKQVYVLKLFSRTVLNNDKGKGKVHPGTSTEAL